MFLQLGAVALAMAAGAQEARIAELRLEERQSRGGLAGLPLAVTLHRQGLVLLDLGKYRAAERSLLRALAIWEKAKPGDPQLGPLLDAISNAYCQTGNWQKAEESARRSLAFAGTRLVSLANLAAILQARGKTAEAEELFARALGMADAFPAAEAALRSNYAVLLSAKNRNSAALAEATRAVRAIGPGDSMTRAGMLLVLGWCQNRAGDRVAAESTTRQAYEMALRLGGARHPLLANILLLHAEIYQCTKRKREARTARAEARSIAEQSARENLLGFSVDVSELTRPRDRRRSGRSTRAVAR